MGKTLSLVSKGIAVIYVIVATLVFSREVGESVGIAGFIAGAFLPVDASLIVANAKAVK